MPVVISGVNTSTHQKNNGEHVQVTLAAGLPGSDTLTTQGASSNTRGITDAEVAFCAASMQVTSLTAVATNWEADFEASLNGSSWTVLFTHTKTANGDGKMVGKVQLIPFRYYRVTARVYSAGSATGLSIQTLVTA